MHIFGVGYFNVRTSMQSSYSFTLPPTPSSISLPPPPQSPLSLGTCLASTWNEKEGCNF